VATGLYVIRQEREVAQKRLEDDRRRVAGRVSDALLAKLEQIRFQESQTWTPGQELSARRSPGDPVAFVGVLRDSRFMLASELNPGPAAAGRALREGEFGHLMAAGEGEEFSGKRFDSAASLYRQALLLAKQPAQSGYARLALARVLVKQGRPAEGEQFWRELLQYSLDVTDEQGVPFAFYAADRLAERGAGFQASWESALAVRTPPAGLFLLNRVADRSASPALRQRLLEQIAWTERVESLQKDFGGLLARYRLQNEEARVWAPQGDPLWLVGMARGVRVPERLVIAVRAEQVGRELGFPGLEVSLLDSIDAVPLPRPFQDLRAKLPATDLASTANLRSREQLLYAAFGMVMMVTLFGGFLAWADLRREIRLARMRSDFVSSVTHELKTPLAAIRMFAETLQTRTKLESPLQAECVDTILGESERLSRLVDNVLELSKIEEGRKTYHMAPVRLAGILDAAVRAMRYPLERAGFTLHLDVEEQLPTIQADADALEQAILNLLTNAVKYSGDSRGIWLSVHGENGDAVIRVRDEGVGIPAEEQKRIFDRFYRVPSKANEAVPGAGLGLTLVEHVAGALGGRVEVESTPGRGSTFSIRIPIGGAA
jgi:signal transduction histidine kinase